MKNGIFTHKHTYGQDIASPRSGERFSMIHDDQGSRFLRPQAKRRVEDEYWAYDSSSISSYSETLNQVQWGRIKLVMDRGFCSEDNINGLYKEHVKFFVGVRLIFSPFLFV